MHQSLQLVANTLERLRVVKLLLNLQDPQWDQTLQPIPGFYIQCDVVKFEYDGKSCEINKTTIKVGEIKISHASREQFPR
jgi:hypothetical protein